VQVKLAEHFMSRKEWKKAEPYAAAAAETWAEWGMRCAVACYEGLADWDKADLWMARVAERYNGRQFDWFLLCKRTGHGNVRKAQLVTDLYFATLGDRATQEDRFNAGFFYLMTNQAPKAMEAFGKTFQMNRGYFIGVWYALLLDVQGKVEQRDQMLQLVSMEPSGLWRIAAIF